MRSALLVGRPCEMSPIEANEHRTPGGDHPFFGSSNSSDGVSTNESAPADELIALALLHPPAGYSLLLGDGTLAGMSNLGEFESANEGSESDECTTEDEEDIKEPGKNGVPATESSFGSENSINIPVNFDSASHSDFSSLEPQEAESPAVHTALDRALMSCLNSTDLQSRGPSFVSGAFSP
ncbi:unnamed protein product [Protopolystoma xenopodis]|uniref:Uncharacterized protein n=1 Tax=Protopolystoma xenopodis TaxID=117903 RepID=A0A448WEE7_9PLAT|nr:unnamed protein product [Protopolystoma xenopodis]